MTETPNPYPPTDWRHGMWAAWCEGLLQVNQGEGWWLYTAACPPSFQYGKNSYRRKS